MEKKDCNINFNKVYIKYHFLLLNYVNKFIKSFDDVEDIVSDIVFYIFNYMKKYNKIPKTKNIIYIANKYILTYYERHNDFNLYPTEDLFTLTNEKKL